jgi:hypothetical protein
MSRRACYHRGMDTRLALAKISSLLLNDRSPAAVEATKVAVWALSDPPLAPGDTWAGWVPDAEHINALPEPLRRYIHDLSTRADPAGDVATLAIQRETIAALERLLEEAPGAAEDQRRKGELS